MVAGLGELEDVACSLGDGAVAEFAGGHPAVAAIRPVRSMTSLRGQIQLPIRYRVHPPSSGITVNDGEAALPVWASTAVQVAVSSYGAACRP